MGLPVNGGTFDEKRIGSFRTTLSVSAQSVCLCETVLLEDIMAELRRDMSENRSVFRSEISTLSAIINSLRNTTMWNFNIEIYAGTITFTYK